MIEQTRKTINQQLLEKQLKLYSLDSKEPDELNSKDKIAECLANISITKIEAKGNNKLHIFNINNSNTQLNYQIMFTKDNQYLNALHYQSYMLDKAKLYSAYKYLEGKQFAQITEIGSFNLETFVRQNKTINQTQGFWLMQEMYKNLIELKKQKLIFGNFSLKNI